MFATRSGDDPRVVADLRAAVACPGRRPCDNASTSSRRWRSAPIAMAASCARYVLPLSYTPVLVNATTGLRPGRAADGVAELRRPRRQAAVAGVGGDDHRGRHSTSTSGGSPPHRASRSSPSCSRSTSSVTAARLVRRQGPRAMTVDSTVPAAEPVLASATCASPFPTQTGPAPAVRGVDFDLHSGEVARHRRRVGFGQERHDAGDVRAARSTATVSGSAKLRAAPSWSVLDPGMLPRPSAAGRSG